MGQRTSTGRHRGQRPKHDFPSIPSLCQVSGIRRHLCQFFFFFSCTHPIQWTNFPLQFVVRGPLPTEMACQEKAGRQATGLRDDTRWRMSEKMNRLLLSLCRLLLFPNKALASQQPGNGIEPKQAINIFPLIFTTCLKLAVKASGEQKRGVQVKILRNYRVGHE